MSKKIMTKNTDKQAIDNLADNFNGYAALLRKIKQRVLVAQQRAIYAANEEMLRMYWDIGGMLQQSQDADGWGKKTLQRLSVDLKNDYSEIKGFSVRNMQCMIQFFNEYNQELTMVKGADSSIAQSMIAQLGEYNFFFPIKHLGWTHNLILLQQVKDIRARYWYMVQSITSHWNTRYLQEAIKLDDYGKHGALANNFTETLPVPEVNDVKSMLKDPYIFDMLTFTDQYNERDVEIGLVKHVEKFLVELLCKGLHKSSSRKCCRLSRMDCSKSFSVTKACSFNPKNSKVTGVLITSLGCNKVACCWTKAERASLFLESPLRS